jgi:glycosyltransferase involved in cell wall biosynthesis
MPDFFNRLDALVLPSLDALRWKELFGRVLIEAMACEVPVVASGSGGIPDVVGDAGILVDPGSVDSLVEHLFRIATNPSKRVEIGKKGRARVLQLFDTPVVAEAFCRDIMNMAGNNTASSPSPR